MCLLFSHGVHEFLVGFAKDSGDGIVAECWDISHWWGFVKVEDFGSHDR